MSVLPFEQVRTWMFDQALPLWGTRGVDTQFGGFFEELGSDGAPTACPYKRVRTMCRQVYVFSHASVLGWPGGEELSRRGFEFLLANARLADGGWARRLSRSGQAIDSTCDLYDLAFVIFASAWRYRASGDPVARQSAHATINFIRNNMRAPGGGFWSALPGVGPRLQNPHMHLTEACLSAFEATGEEIYIDTAEEVITLFHTHLFDGRSLGERFSEDWSREAGDIEPGHHFEWAWILGQHQKVARAQTASSTRAAVFALISLGEQHGVDPTSQAVYDALAQDGSPTRTSSRIWPNTERIKAHLAAFELTQQSRAEQVGGSLQLIFNRYFASSIGGLWIDQFDSKGRPLTDAVPSSCVYHLFLAFSELLRLQQRIETAR